MWLFMFKWGKNRQEWLKFYFNLQINLRYIDVSHLHLRFPTVSEKISCVTVNVKDKLNRMISIQVRAKDWPQMHTMFIFNWHYGNFHYSRFLQLWHSLSLVHLHLNLHSHYRHSAVQTSPYLSISQRLDFHKSIQTMNNTWWCYGRCLE